MIDKLMLHTLTAISVLLVTSVLVAGCETHPRHHATFTPPPPDSSTWHSHYVRPYHAPDYPPHYYATRPGL